MWRWMWSPRPASNRRPARYKGTALPSELHGRNKKRHGNQGRSRTGFFGVATRRITVLPPGQNGAGDGTRTRDLRLGKAPLYQLSYSRKLKYIGAHGGTRTHNLRRRRKPLYPVELRGPNTGAGGRNRTCGLSITNRLLYHLSYAGVKDWSEMGDSNPRHPAPKAGALPS